MFGGEPGGLVEGGREQHLRRLYVGMALLAALVQACIAQYAQSNALPGLNLQALLGLGFNLLLVGLAAWQRVPAHVFQLILIVSGQLWVLSSALLFVRAEIPSATLLVGFLTMALFAFAWLRAPAAAALTLAGYLLLVGPVAAARPLDPPGLLMTGFAATLIWFLSAHGQSLHRAHLRNDALATLAFTDPLTGVLNRRSGRERLDGALRAARAHPQRLAAVLIDIDHFKRVNDSLGHHRGDEILIALADLLERSVTPQDAVIRWGGEEFLLLLAGRDPQDAQALAWQVVRAVRAQRLPGFPPVTVSAGMALASEAEGVPGWLALADARLYAAKDAGRDRVVHQGSRETPHAQAPPS
ncbi:GGDEF domain-containing protein [Deinococcus seoulensis]|uniref:GGDEF domain-containing protein n=1 Tax=Deinococcus seoulensis TaxID=1837379 RepID=UPI00166A0DCB|nr:GGDEF domain-containing protein [Deinococcus seoulensis]